MLIDTISILVADPAEPVRQAMVAMLRHQGVSSCHGVQNLKRMRTAVQDHPYDLIVASDDLDPDVFRLLRDIRHDRVGFNPFTVVTMMVTPGSARSFQRAILCGADDILIKPVVPHKIVARTKHIAYHRLPFAATTDYIGPFRKQLGLHEKTPLLEVLNTLRDKLDGKTFTLSSLMDAVTASMTKVKGGAARQSWAAHGIQLPPGVEGL